MDYESFKKSVQHAGKTKLGSLKDVLLQEENTPIMLAWITKQGEVAFGVAEPIAWTNEQREELAAIIVPLLKTLMIRGIEHHAEEKKKSQVDAYEEAEKEEKS